MSKNIILLSDGTGNGAAKRHKTNVWRLYDALDLHREDQVAFYDDGVGSQEFLPLKIVGGAFGWGLKENVLELYKFLCRNYEEGDRIYGFGFSRGAFTVRMLVGLIVECGVYTQYRSEEELDKVARQNYYVFRSVFNTGLLTRWFRYLRDKNYTITTDYSPEIEFIGVWDTVDAYGFPVDEIARLWDYLIYPIYFPDFELSPSVLKACHAVSVDDERHTFHPLLWDESGETDPERIEQVWFPGVHADVGGGYPDYALSLVTLDWMMARCEASSKTRGSPGLHLIESQRQAVFQHSDWHGRQHDSRSLFGAYYRYKPRHIEKLCNDAKKRVRIELPKIHESVLGRIARNVTPYAPTAIPEKYALVATYTEPVPYETGIEIQQRTEAMQPVKAVINKRQWIYRFLLMVTLAFLLAPLLAWVLSRWGEPADIKIGESMQTLLGFMPEIVTPWMTAFICYPLLFALLLLAFIRLLVKKHQAWNQTSRIAMDAWRGLKKKDRVKQTSASERA